MLAKYGFVILLVLFSCVGSNAGGGSADDSLGSLNEFTGQIWLGHYSNAEHAHYNHVVRWSTELDGKAVRVVKKVPELNFMMETVLFWDPDIEQVSFVSLTNRGQVARGTAVKENGELVLLGVSKAEGDSREFKTTYRLLADGILEDRFFIKRSGEWDQRHLISHTVTDDPAFTELFE